MVSDDGHVLSLVTEAVGDGPFNLVLPDVDFSGHVSFSARVESSADRLCIGEIEIDTRSARGWEARPDWQQIRMQTKRLRGNLAHILAALENSRPHEGLAGLTVDLAVERDTLTETLLRQARPSAEKLVFGLRAADESLCRQGARELAGLGGGLTPAGDDWIVGALVGSWVLWSESEAARLGGVVTQAAQQSPALSYAWIRAAAEGECNARWHGLLGTLQGDDDSRIRIAAQSVLAQGHTSGADALAGFLTVLWSD